MRNLALACVALCAALGGCAPDVPPKAPIPPRQAAPREIRQGSPKSRISLMRSGSAKMVSGQGIARWCEAMDFDEQMAHFTVALEMGIGKLIARGYGGYALVVAEFLEREDLGPASLRYAAALREVGPYMLPRAEQKEFVHFMAGKEQEGRELVERLDGELEDDREALARELETYYSPSRPR